MLLWEEETVKQKTHWNINKKKKKKKEKPPNQIWSLFQSVQLAYMFFHPPHDP